MDHRRFLQCLLPCENQLRGYLLAATGDPDEVEDLMQEVSATLWEKFDAYDPGRPFAAWALGVARTELLRWRRRKARARPTVSVEAVEALCEAASEIAEETDARRVHLRDCLRRLTGGARRAVELKYREGLTIAGIAGRLSRSVAAVEMLLVRARRFLRRCMERRLREAAEVEA
jgi:RNA polymerase sigma-70 factor